MFAAFLRTPEGSFDYGPAFGAALFTALVLIDVWILYGALKKHRVPFGFAGTYTESKIYWFERDRSPGWYWFAVSAYGLMIPFCMWAVYALCTGFFQNAN